MENKSITRNPTPHPQLEIKTNKFLQMLGYPKVKVYNANITLKGKIAEDGWYQMYKSKGPIITLQKNLEKKEKIRTLTHEIGHHIIECDHHWINENTDLPSEILANTLGWVIRRMWDWRY